MSFEDRLKVLEGALAIGRQANLFSADEVKSRMEVVQARATTATSVPDTPLFAKIRSWFWSRTETEPTS